MLVLIALLMAPLARAGNVELFVEAGPATWSKCGENGCWRQPPLPSQWNLRTQAQAIGLAWHDVELAYRNLGEASVCGVYVRDADYDPHLAALKSKHAERWNICTQQHTNGFSLMYAPRFELHRLLQLQPSIGLLRISQTQDLRWLDNRKLKHGSEQVVVEGQVLHTMHLHSSGRITPAAGLRAYVQFDNLLIGYGAEWFWRPRFRDSLAGGGDKSKIGLRVQVLSVRWAFKE